MPTIQVVGLLEPSESQPQVDPLLSLRGADPELDYHISLARKLIGELTGLDEAAFAAI